MQFTVDTYLWARESQRCFHTKAVHELTNMRLSAASNDAPSEAQGKQETTKKLAGMRKMRFRLVNADREKRCGERLLF